MAKGYVNTPWGVGIRGSEEDLDDPNTPAGKWFEEAAERIGKDERLHEIIRESRKKGGPLNDKT